MVTLFNAQSLMRLAGLPVMTSLFHLFIGLLILVCRKIPHPVIKFLSISEAKDLGLPPRHVMLNYFDAAN